MFDRTVFRAALAVVLAAQLAACGRGGDDELIRRVAAAEAAASRAEQAQVKAERAAAKAEPPQVASVNTVEEEDDVDPYDAEEEDFNPDSGKFDNTIVSPEPPPPPPTAMSEAAPPPGADGLA